MRIPFRLIGGVLVATLLTQLTACGSIFYPDRRGQIDGKIDPAIAVLDAVGLLFYIIPGLIALPSTSPPARFISNRARQPRSIRKTQTSHRRRRQGR
jgi:hypothetical protein